MPDPSRQRVAIVSPFFHPEPISTGRYNTHLARGLVERGCDVTVVCSHPVYPDWVVRESHARVDGVRTIRGGLGIRYRRSAVLRRLRLEYWFGTYALSNIRRLRRELDLAIIVLPPFLYLLGLPWLLASDTRLVAIVHDLQGVMAGSTPTAMRRLLGGILRSLEARALRRCEVVVCLSESMAAFVRNRYGIASERCLVHYPFVTLPASAPAPAPLAGFAEGFKHVVYSGALGEKQLPELLAQFFIALTKRYPDVMGHVLSRGPGADTVRAMVTAAGADRVRCADLVAEERLPDLYAWSCVQLIPQAPGIGVGAFPSKLPNLLAAGVPVLAICDGESELGIIVKEADSGIVVHSMDPTNWVTAIEPLLMLDSQHREELRQRTLRFAVDRFGLAPLLDSLLLKPAPGRPEQAHRAGPTE